jgi:hypothetical protein
MSMSVHLCEEIHVYDNVAEPTGSTVDLAGLKREPRVCTTVSDLVRKHRQHGDGHFYLPQGQWPQGEKSLAIEKLKELTRKKRTEPIRSESV